MAAPVNPGPVHDPEKHVFDWIGDGYRFSDKIMRKTKGRVAQLVEHLTFNQVVPGSSPGALTTQNPSKAFQRLTTRNCKPSRSPQPDRHGAASFAHRSSGVPHGFKI
jgi:hypothetical protein